MTESPIEALNRLRDALRGFAVALASGRTDAVLSAERPLVDAVRQLPAPASARGFDDRATVRALVGEIKDLMRHCERLGAAARDLTMLSGRFAQSAYGRRGTFAAPLARSTVITRS